MSVALTGKLARQVRSVAARFATVGLTPPSAHAVAVRAIELGLTPLCAELLDAARAVVAAGEGITDDTTAPASPAQEGNAP